MRFRSRAKWKDGTLWSVSPELGTSHRWPSADFPGLKVAAPPNLSLFLCNRDLGMPA
jgi:hypothetical protein